MRLKEHEKSYRLSFDNGISVEILKQGGTFKGLGQVKLRRRKLRSAQLPITPLIRTPDGYEVSRLEFADLQKGAESLTLTLTPHVRRCGRMEWACCDGQDRWNVGPWEQEEERDRGGLLQMRLRAVERNIGGTQFVGFSYSYKFRSRKYRIYRIHDRGTWELGSRATGNSFWMPGPFNELQKTFRNKSDQFTTAWFRSTGSTVQLQQFLPFFSVLQGFTFQFNPYNLLVTAFEAPFHCRSLFQKNSGQNYFVHWHQLCGDLGGCLEFPALQVLCAESNGEGEIERANQYCAIREELHRGYCDQRGLVREGAVVSSRLLTSDGAYTEALERSLDGFAHAACKRVYLPGLLHSRTPRDRSGAEAGRSSASSQKALQQVRHIIQHAHHRGMEVALSLVDCCLGWVVAGSMAGESSNQWRRLERADGNGLVARALRDGDARRLLLNHLRKLKKELGVDALFADSPLDGIADQFDWAWPANEDTRSGSGGALELDQNAGQIRGLERARADLIAALQRMGYRCPLTSAGGLATPCARRNCEVLRGREFMFRDQVVEFPYERITESGDDPLEAYFRGCANRLSYTTTRDAGSGMDGTLEHWWQQEYTVVNKAYHAVRDYMEHSHLLPEDRGILWTGADPDVQVLWAYKEFTWEVGRHAEIFDVMATKPVEPEGGVFTPRPCRAYLIQNAQGL